MDDAEIERRARGLVERGVLAEVTALIDVFAEGVDAKTWRDDIRRLIGKSEMLSGYVPDYAAGAKMNGWRWTDGGTVELEEDGKILATASSWQAACEAERIDVPERYICSAWMVTRELGRALAAVGAIVDFDFGGLVIWARTADTQEVWRDPAILHLASR